MLRSHRSRVLASIVVGVVALVSSACTGSGTASPEAGTPRETSTTTTTAPDGDRPAEMGTSTSLPDRPGEVPLQPAEMVDGASACKDMAKGPWTRIAYATDPIAMVRAGRTPEISSASNAPKVDEIVEYPTLADYDDPSTIRDPEAVLGAFKAAGYREGVAARFYDPPEEVAVVAIRFRDAAAAQSAMTAHLSDYCQRAVSSGLRPQGNGMIVLRDQGAVRSFFVLDDVEVSVFVCRCYFTDELRRKEGVEQWAERVEEALLAPDPQSPSA